MALNDITKNHGVAVLDPKNDLVELLLKHIPKHRAKDTIYLSGRNPIPIDFMTWETADEKEQLADDIQLTIEQLSVNTAGDRWPSILQWAIKAVLEARDCSFIDIYHFLTDENTRAKILSRVSDKYTIDYWEREFKHDKQFVSSITSRLGKFLTPEFRIILGSPKGLRISEDVMEAQRVLLVNLAKTGRRSGNLLGRLLVSKIQQATMKRVDQDKNKRKRFYLYADEFQRFQTSAFDDILSEAGGLQLCLTLAHQYPEQLEERIRNSILGNVSTFFLFRLRPSAAALFKDEIPSMENKSVWKRSPKTGEMEWIKEPIPFDTKALASFPQGRVLYRAADGTAKIFTTPKPPERPYAHYAEAIKKRTMKVYGLPLLPHSENKVPLGQVEHPHGNPHPTDEIEPQTGPIQDIPRHSDED